MKKFFYSHPEIVLTVIAVILLGSLAWFLSWSINDIFFEVHRAMVVNPETNTANYDIQDAAKLDLRGTLNTSTIQAASEAPATSTRSTSTIIIAPIKASTSTATSSTK